MYTKNINAFKTLIFLPKNNFSTQSADPLEGYSFEQLIELKSTESLTKAAEIMAELEIEHENL